MRGNRPVWPCWIQGLVIGLLAGGAAAQSGTIVGNVSHQTRGGGVGGVTVVITQLARAEITDGSGNYAFEGVPAGSYNLSFSLGDNLVSAEVEVAAGRTLRFDQQVAWDVSFAETITVFSASRRRERIVEAPAAVTVLSEEQIERESAHGQLPKLLEFTPGAEVTQSGLYDFNLNTRGFNSSLNRRVPTLIDGRDPSVPFLGAQDWPSMSFPLNDLASAELVRGPSSALYGTNAFNGVLNLTTKQPRYSQGGSFRLTAGELSTLRGDFRWASELGNDFYLKALGSYTSSDDFYRSRNPRVGCTPEYAGAPCEAVPVGRTDDVITTAGLRLDKYFGTNALTVEAGYNKTEGPVLQTGIGRVQVLDAERPFLRLNLSGTHYNVLTYHNERDASQQLALSSGANLVLDSTIDAVEVQGNAEFAEGKGRLVGGASYRKEEIATQGTLTRADIDEDRTAAFAQLEYAFSNQFKAVVAGRYDESSLHDSQVSPKVALVYSPSPSHSVRFTYNEAFQSPNYSEFFLFAPVAPPVSLAPIEGICTLGGVSCGFGTPLTVAANGNADLEVEQIKTWEVGYSGILGGRVFLTVDYYNSELENFVTDLLPNPQGSTNPNFGPYVPPAGLSEPFRTLLLNTLRGALGPSFFILSNLPDGTPFFSAVSYTNAGSADAQGVDLGLNVAIDNNWVLDFTYSWFDFEILSQQLGDRVLPNSPEHKYALGLSYNAKPVDVSLHYRWVDDFDWAAGAFFGPVESYNTVDLHANYSINDQWRVGINVANLLDDEHYESFGGDLLARRALGHVSYSW